MIKIGTGYYNLQDIVYIRKTGNSYYSNVWVEINIRNETTYYKECVSQEEWDDIKTYLNTLCNNK